jgi:hypothetical protein
VDRDVVPSAPVKVDYGVPIKTKAHGKHFPEFGNPLSNLYSLSGSRIEPILGTAIGYRKRGQTNERDH